MHACAVFAFGIICLGPEDRVPLALARNREGLSRFMSNSSGLFSRYNLVVIIVVELLFRGYSSSSCQAESATWLESPPDGNWSDASNWSPATIPNGSMDVATFGPSTQNTVSFSPEIRENAVSEIRFTNDAVGYTIRVAPADYTIITIGGAGIINGSDVSQKFVTDRLVGKPNLVFTNEAKAGTMTTFLNHGGFSPEFGTYFPSVEFRETSNAQAGMFQNDAGVVQGAIPGHVVFYDDTNAGSAVFLNRGGTSRVDGGSTKFFGNGSAGQATIVNEGATASEINIFPNSGFVWFGEYSTAGNAVIVNEGSSASSATGGVTFFMDDSTAGNTMITNRAGSVNSAFGGFTQFGSHSTAGSGSFVNKGAGVVGAYGGAVTFRGNASAEYASFVNEHGSTGTLGTAGGVGFIETANAGRAVFVSNGGTSVTESGGYVIFRNSSSAAEGTFTNEGGTSAGAIGGGTYFKDTSTAGNASFICDPGSNGGFGGTVQFMGGSVGATANIVVVGNGSLRLSEHDPPGLSIGSLEGSGSVFLGANDLTIGSSNNNTVFSGGIQDTGSVTKIGLGELNLTGSNNYTGLTTVNGGRLIVHGSIISEVVVYNGGELGGSGATGSVTVNEGGIVRPIGAQPLQVDGQFVQYVGGVLRFDVDAVPRGAGQIAIVGDAALNGTLEVRFVNGFLPTSGQVFRLFHVGGAVTGSFAQINFPDLRAGFQFHGEFAEGYYQITALSDGMPGTGFLNISTRMQVGTGDNALISGFIVTGTMSKRVIIRAIGPSLESDGTPVPGRLLDPILELRDSAGALLLSNNNWIESQQVQEIIESGIPPADESEAAIVSTLMPGSYTAVMRGVNDTSGIGVAEVYDLSPNESKLANISTRGFVQTGDSVMIGGFIVDNQAMHVVARALGPSLTQSGVPDALADPTLELHDIQGSVIAFNDDWQETSQAAIEGTGIAPQNDKESAILVTLSPAAYTAIVRGKNETTGVGLVEVYDLQ